MRLISEWPGIMGQACAEWQRILPAWRAPTLEHLVATGKQGLSAMDVDLPKTRL